jgi:hypothetical protein
MKVNIVVYRSLLLVTCPIDDQDLIDEYITYVDLLPSEKRTEMLKKVGKAQKKAMADYPNRWTTAILEKR